MGLSVFKARQPSSSSSSSSISSSSSEPRQRRQRWPRVFGAELGSSVPEVVSCLLLYITLWAAPPPRVAGSSRWAKARSNKLKRKIMKGKFLPEEDLFDGRPPRLTLGVAPEVAMLVVRDYLQELPGYLLSDACSWHILGHDLLLINEGPWHHHMPHAFLAQIRALRVAMTPTHNLLLDQVVSAIRSSGASRPAFILAAAKVWAPVLVRPPTPSECLPCAYRHRQDTSLGVAHALYYLARFGILVYTSPFSSVTRGSASAWRSTQGTATPRQYSCDLCQEDHVM